MRGQENLLAEAYRFINPWSAGRYLWRLLAVYVGVAAIVAIVFGLMA
jgi:hypothetical protein